MRAKRQVRHLACHADRIATVPTLYFHTFTLQRVRLTNWLAELIQFRHQLIGRKQQRTTPKRRRRPMHLPRCPNHRPCGIPFWNCNSSALGYSGGIGQHRQITAVLHARSRGGSGPFQSRNRSGGKLIHATSLFGQTAR
jgi:hypothetical protein